MAIENSITFGGVNSADFGIYISGEGVFNAPKRDVDMVTIPGRNGQLALDKGRFENIEVTYPAFNFEPNDYDTFAQRLSDFRNAICAQRGYQRLEDTFHPDEYRMATYIDGLDIKPIKYNTASEFDIVFNCKPQRWLKDGETAVTIGEWGETETASGDIVTVENEDGVLAVKSLEVDIEPIQDLHGYDKPWSGGNGKNKLPNTATRTTTGGVTFTIDEEGVVTANGTATADAYLHIADGVPLVSGQTYTLSGVVTASQTAYMYLEESVTSSWRARDYGSGATFSAPTNSVNAVIRIASGATVNNVKFKPMIEVGSTATAYEPYSNICPISGHDSVDVIVSPTTTASDGTTYTTALGRTVYGGNLEQISGVLTDNMAMVTFDGSSDENWNFTTFGGMRRAYIAVADIDTTTSDTSIANIVSNQFSAISYQQGQANVGISARFNIAQINVFQNEYTTLAEWKSYLASNPLQVVYELAEPQIYQLTPQQIELLRTNNIWSDSGDVTVEYGQNPNVLINPTLFESSPLVAISGYGTVGFNGHEIELDSGQLGEISILSSGTYKMDSRYSKYKVTFDEKKYNVGDTITISNLKAIFGEITGDSYEEGVYKATYITSLSRVSDSVSGAVSTVSLVDSQYSFNIYKVVTEFPELTFTIGTAEQIENVAIMSGTATRGGEARTFSHQRIITRVTYDGNGSIEFWLTNGIESSEPFYLSVRNESMETSGIAGFSTVSMLGNPTYIDCDFGEAYLLIDGTPVSLNGYVDLGSDLPTLAPGNNEITYDDTVTQLDITPRWWKI